MSDDLASVPTPDDVTVERWQYTNQSRMVIVVHSVISTGLTGEVVEEIEVKVEHRETGEIVGATGFTVAMALAMIDHLINERF